VKLNHVRLTFPEIIKFIKKTKSEICMSKIHFSIFSIDWYNSHFSDLVIISKLNYPWDLEKKSKKFLQIGPRFMDPKSVSRPPLSIGIVDVLVIW